MYGIIISILLAPVFSIAATPAIKKQYDDFQKTYTQTLELSKDKVLFAKEFDKKNKSLKKKYDDLVKTEKSSLSNEGNQMALDIEMLEPLEFLASSRINKESCSEADFLNELNEKSDPETFQRIKKSLQTLCK